MRFHDTGTVYLVSAETGEYSSRQEWPVAVFDSEEAGEEFRAECERLAKDANVPGVGVRGDHPLDPGFDRDYTGTRYYLLEVRKVEPV